MKEKIKKFREYLDYIEEHYDNVQRAWMLINKECKNKGFYFLDNDDIWGMIDCHIAEHDLSKLSSEEFTQYRAYFFPTETEKPVSEYSKDQFEKAWENHKKENAHHWQSWTNTPLSSDESVACLIHNICDWMAMGFKFNDTAKRYYEKNKDKITMPEWAVNLMYEVFECVYEG